MRYSPFARPFAGPTTLGLDSVLPGTPDADELAGGPGADLILGQAGDDRILGRGGDDTILTGAGNDTVFGDDEIGPPPALPGRPEPDVLPGNNLIHGGSGDDNITAGWGADTVFAGSGDDLILGYGGGYPSPGGFDVYLRAEGSDLLHGGAGNDTVDGGGGNDVLMGGAGDDVLFGGYGVDLLAGGPGADRFVFRFYDPFLTSPDTGVGEGNRDVILDFRPGDVIDLSGYKVPGSDVSESVFLGTDPFMATNALQVRYEVADGRTVVQFYAPRFSVPDGLPAPTGEIELAGVHTLTEADFIL